MQFFFSKLPEVSWEHFSKHYAHIHSDLTVAAKSFGVHHVQRYTQVRRPGPLGSLPIKRTELIVHFSNTNRQR